MQPQPITDPPCRQPDIPPPDQGPAGGRRRRLSWAARRRARKLARARAWVPAVIDAWADGLGHAELGLILDAATAAARERLTREPGRFGLVGRARVDGKLGRRGPTAGEG